MKQKRERRENHAENLCDFLHDRIQFYDNHGKKDNYMVLESVKKVLMDLDEIKVRVPARLSKEDDK